MRKVLNLLLFLLSISLPFSAFAILNIELTRGMAGAMPIAIVPFANTINSTTDEKNALQQDLLSYVVSQDLQNSGRFKVVTKPTLKEFPSDAEEISSTYFRRLGVDNVVVGKIIPIGGENYKVSFQMVDMYGGGQAREVLKGSYRVTAKELRALAHHISDAIYEKLTGIRGIFSTKLAYVVVSKDEKNGKDRYALEVADQDGYNPRPLLISNEPIMSPAWAPNGKQIAYVSFENRKSHIYVQDVVTGMRQVISDFPGINGAPAWSPNGKKLALVLSKGESPNIYIMDIASKKLIPVTNDFYINTEPAWSPDGAALLFTSTRSGGPQIYQANLRTLSTSRLTYDGDYNARASYAKDGKNIVMIHRVSGIFNIALLDLDTGRMQVISNATTDSASPSIAPNSSMVLYDTVFNGRNILAMVSSDGRIKLRLPARNGEAQDPAWSPFLS